MKNIELVLTSTLIISLISLLFLFSIPKDIQINTYISAPAQVLSIEIKTPRRTFSQPPPQISAISALAVDYDSGMLLFEKNSNLPFPPASLTKLMTALVALENCNQDKNIKIKKVQNNGTQMGLIPNDVVNVESLIYGLLLPSGNDAAEALAQNCGSSYEQFIYSLNKKSEQLGMINTHFTNPAGFESKNHSSTAEDLLILAKTALSVPLIYEVVSTKEKIVYDTLGKKQYHLRNLNKLLTGENGVFGVKTGTGTFGENLILGYQKDNQKILIAVLGSNDRFFDATLIKDWVFESYRWPNESVSTF